MLSYKNWKKLNESLLGAPYTLGVKSEMGIGNMDMGMNGPETAFHKKKKAPFADEEDFEDEEEFEDEEGDEEDFEDEEFEDEEGDEEDFEDEEFEDEEGDEEDFEDEEFEDEEFPAKKKPMMAPPMGEAKCPPVEDEEDIEIEDEDEEEEDVEEIEDEEDEEEEIEFQKKKMGKGKKKMSHSYQKKKMGGKSYQKKKMSMPDIKMQKKKQKKKMTKEEYDFLASLQKQTGSTKFAIGDSGFWMPVQEDALIAPTDPNANVINNEPRPGEVGYAPQGRIG